MKIRMLSALAGCLVLVGIMVGAAAVPTHTSAHWPIGSVQDHGL